MARTIDKIKEKILEQVLSQDELENIMVESHYYLIEDGDFDDSEDTEVIRFTNYSSHIWVDIERDEDRSVLVTNVRRISRTEYESTRSEPFRSYEDFEKIMNHFMDKKFYIVALAFPVTGVLIFNILPIIFMYSLVYM